MKILLIEDDATASEYLGNALAESGQIGALMHAF